MHAVFFGMKRAFYSSLEWLKRVFARHGLTPARFDMLYVIDQEEFCFQRSLQDVLGVSAATVSRMLRSLRRLGLVESAVNEDDRRTKLVALTELGDAVLRGAIHDVLGSGIGGLAAATALSLDWCDERLSARAIGHFLAPLRCVRETFADRACLHYGEGPGD
jgi:DNA-binding MarR family transcriptional regulator